MCPSTRKSSRTIHRHEPQLPVRLSRHNMSSTGADSGYSEDSFALTRNSSHTRPLHTSCPHCHCEQRSSFSNYRKSMKTLSTESSTSDTTINKGALSAEFYSQHHHHHHHQQQQQQQQPQHHQHRQRQQEKQSLSTSRSYPHIKPLPKTDPSSPITASSTQQQQQTHPQQQQQKQQRRTRSATTRRRRRHLSCDSSLWTKVQTTQQIHSVGCRWTSLCQNVSCSFMGLSINFSNRRRLSLSRLMFLYIDTSLPSA
jgi:hypothetical protein